MCKYLKQPLYVLLFLISISGCKKYLDKKPDKSRVVLTTLADMQALLDDYNQMNRSDPSGGEISSDNYYLTAEDWKDLEDGLKQMYIWSDGDYFPGINNMWNNAWQPIYSANTILDYISSIERNDANKLQYDDIRGQALFYRGRQFFQNAVTWCLAYDSLTAKTDLGLPLRLNSDFNEQSIRSDNETTYRQIIQDLVQSIRLLPTTTISPFRPNKPGAYATLARVYLSMRKYNLAGRYADSALQLYSSLMDYNTLSKTSSRPIPKLNVENIFYAEAGNWGPLSNSRAKVDSSLYNSYDDNDLRKVIFFKSNNNGTFGFKATYTEGTGQFTGPATDEVFLMRAECYAREGKKDLALTDLNTLLIARWKTGTFLPFEAENALEALDLILRERRKELLYRELRWMDIKRLNKENPDITLRRNLDGETYELSPNDLRYALPIPFEVIDISKMQQNPR